MPIKRSSAPGSPATFNSQIPRHRQSEMPHDTHSMSDFGVVSRSNEPNMGEQKIVSALVGRLVNKVSGLPTGFLDLA